MPSTVSGTEQDVQFIASWFSVEVNGVAEGFFTEAGGLGVEIEVVEQTDAAVDTATRKLAGSTKYSEVTLKRALSENRDFFDWAKRIRDGDTDFRANGSIVLHDMGGTETGRWNFERAWPSKWSASDLDVGSDDLMMEEVTLQIEFIERVN